MTPETLAMLAAGLKELWDDDGYAPVNAEFIAPVTALKMEAIMVAGVKMKDASGLAKPFRTPPPVALAILQELATLAYAGSPK